MRLETTRSAPHEFISHIRDEILKMENDSGEKPTAIILECYEEMVAFYLEYSKLTVGGEYSFKKYLEDLSLGAVAFEGFQVKRGF